MRLNKLHLLVLFATLSGASLLAQQPDGGPPMGPGQRSDQARGGWGDGMRSGLLMGPPGIWWHNPDLVQKLTLTPDQQKRMDDILQQSRLQLVDLKANVEKQELLMEPMLAANPPDTNKVLAQIDHTAQARAELEKARAKMLLSIRNVLTPDQWTKLQAEERDNRRSRMMHGGMREGTTPPGGPGAMLSTPETNPHHQRELDGGVIALAAY
jgi:Spy/CpxP family protein refolding chaperone